MSRIGKKPVKVPENVQVKIETEKITVKGPKGELTQQISPLVKVELKDNQILVSPLDLDKVKGREAKKIKSLWGVTRILLANLIKGVTEGFEKKLEISGIGYKAEVSGGQLVLSVGFSHPVQLTIPAGINVAVNKNIITVSGINKEAVGQFAALIREVRPCEPYKGKGIKYLDEIVRRKVGKKAVTAGAK